MASAVGYVLPRIRRSDRDYKSNHLDEQECLCHKVGPPPKAAPYKSERVSRPARVPRAATVA